MKKQVRLKFLRLGRNEILICYLLAIFCAEEFRHWLEEQKKFRDHIQTVCLKYGKLVKNVPVQIADLMFDNQTKLLLCGNGKVQ